MFIFAPFDLGRGSSVCALRGKVYRIDHALRSVYIAYHVNTACTICDLMQPPWDPPDSCSFRRTPETVIGFISESLTRVFVPLSRSVVSVCRISVFVLSSEVEREREREKA